MALSEKLLRILRSKTTLTEGELESLTERAGWEIVYSFGRMAKESLIEVCFTGFSPKEKAELHKAAQEKNLYVAKTITQNLSFLCVGDNAGPSKLEKAEKQNVQIISKDEFLELLQTGELPQRPTSSALH